MIFKFLVLTCMKKFRTLTMMAFHWTPLMKGKLMIPSIHVCTFGFIKNENVYSFMLMEICWSMYLSNLRACHFSISQTLGVFLRVHLNRYNYALDSLTRGPLTPQKNKKCKLLAILFKKPPEYLRFSPRQNGY